MSDACPIHKTYTYPCPQCLGNHMSYDKEKGEKLFAASQELIKSQTESIDELLEKNDKLKLSRKELIKKLSKDLHDYKVVQELMGDVSIHELAIYFDVLNRILIYASKEVE